MSEIYDKASDQAIDDNRNLKSFFGNDFVDCKTVGKGQLLGCIIKNIPGT